jgi:hypothetical protein
MKRIPYIVLTVILALNLASCNKYKQTENDLRGNNYIAGIVFLRNDYSANGILTPLPKFKVQIGYAADTPTSNYFYSVNTDTNGIFIFTNLRNNTPYIIFATDTLNKISFYGLVSNTLLQDKNPVTNDTLILEADTLHQNGFVYTVTDTAGNVINNCMVCVFDNPILFMQNDDACSGYIFDLTTNTFGKASQFNINPGIYMTQFKVIFGTHIFTAADTINVKTAGIVRDTIKAILN